MTTTRPSPTIVHEDRWGTIVDHEDLDLLETRWFDSTADLTTEEFNDWLALFADHLERLHRSRVLVDATVFHMDPTRVDTEWRDTHIIPRYERIGVRKFAFHMPAGMPAVGRAPQPEGPATFPTGYFSSRVDALRWLTS